MESINKILKRDASYASTNMAVGTSVTTPIRANISKIGAVDNSKHLELTPFEKPLFEKAIMGGKTMEEALSFARKALFMKMKERRTENPTSRATSGYYKWYRSENDSAQKVHPVEQQRPNVAGGTVNLSLLPFDVKNSPLNFGQMEKIQATIIDMIIENNCREINAESLNCQFKTGWMAFKCNTATAEWLKSNCNDISKKCKVGLKVAEEVNQEENNFKQSQSKPASSSHLKRGYYMPLNNLKQIRIADESGEPIKNAKVIRIKYQSMMDDYLETQKKERRIRKFLIRDGILAGPKKAKPLHRNYRMALHCLDKLKKIEQSGTYLDAKKLMSRRKHQMVVDSFLKEQRRLKKLKVVRPYHEVITDPLCFTVGGKSKGLIVPIPTQWHAIRLQIEELANSYVLEYPDADPVPLYDFSEVHRGFRVIRCMDEFSKKFLFKCINSIKDKWKDLNLMIIPASQIPRTIRDPLNLDVEAALKEVNQSLAQRPQSSNHFRSSDSQKPQYYDLTEKTITSSSHDVTEQPQTSRMAAEFSIQNRSNPFRSSELETYPQGVSTKIPANFTENSRFRAQFSPTSLQSKNYLNSAVDSEFNDRFSARNRSSRRSNDRNPNQSQSLTNTEDLWKACDVADKSGSERQFHQDSSSDWNNSYRNYRFAASSETSRRSGDRRESQSQVPMNSGYWQGVSDVFVNSDSNKSQFYQDSLADYSRPYNKDSLPAYNETSREDRVRNEAQRHTQTNLEDWRRSTDFYENSRLNVTKFYPDSPPHCNDSHRNERSLEDDNLLRQSRDRNPVQRLYRNDIEPPPNETSMWRGKNRNRPESPTPNKAEWRKSPDFQSYGDFPRHSSNRYRNSSPSASFRSRYPKEDTFHMSSTEAAKYNVRGNESYRSKQFHDVSPHRDFESSSNYFLQPDPRNCNTYNRRRENYGDNDKPPPAPRWN